MTIKMVTSLPQTLASIENLIRRGPGKKFMDEIGNDIVKKIKARSSQGKDVNNNPFETLQGDDHKAQATSTLNQSGQMLSALDKQSSSREVRVFVKSSSRRRQRINNFQLAEVHNLGLRSGRGKGFKMPQREFMGLTNDEWKDIGQKIERDYDKIVIKILKSGGITVLK